MAETVARRLPSLARDLRRAGRLAPAALADLARAAAELAIARVRFGLSPHRDLLPDAGDWPEPGTGAPLDRRSDRLAERVAFAIPRVANRLPWRADCLVQALAAQRWLARRGVKTRLFVGVRKPSPAGIEPHAWLVAGDRVVTGGSIDDYSPLTAAPR